MTKLRGWNNTKYLVLWLATGQYFNNEPFHLCFYSLRTQFAYFNAISKQWTQLVLKDLPSVSLGLSTRLAWWEREAVRGQHWLMVLAVCGAERRERASVVELIMKRWREAKLTYFSSAYLFPFNLLPTPSSLNCTQSRKREFYRLPPTVSCIEKSKDFSFHQKDEYHWENVT